MHEDRCGSLQDAPVEYARIEETFAPEALQLVCDWVVERTKRLGR